MILEKKTKKNTLILTYLWFFSLELWEQSCLSCNPQCHSPQFLHGRQKRATEILSSKDLLLSWRQWSQQPVFFWVKQNVKFQPLKPAQAALRIAPIQVPCPVQALWGCTTAELLLRWVKSRKEACTSQTYSLGKGSNHQLESKQGSLPWREPTHSLMCYELELFQAELRLSYPGNCGGTSEYN